MSTSEFSRQLKQRLNFSRTEDEPYERAYQALSGVVEAIEKQMNEGLPQAPIKIGLEPGFRARIGQQFKVILRVEEKHFRDTLFRAYIPAEGFPMALDLFAEESQQCENEEKLQRQILEFMEDIRERMAAYRLYAKPK